MKTNSVSTGVPVCGAELARIVESYFNGSAIESFSYAQVPQGEGGEIHCSLTAETGHTIRCVIKGPDGSKEFIDSTQSSTPLHLQGVDIVRLCICKSGDAFTGFALHFKKSALHQCQLFRLMVAEGFKGQVSCEVFHSEAVLA